MALHLAQGASVEDQFIETVIYALLFLFMVAALFVVSKLIKHQTTTRIRNQQTPFAMTTTDLEKMKASGQLTEEELKAIRRTMARNLMERTEEEERKRQEKPQLTADRPTLEDEVRRRSIATMRGRLQEDQDAPADPLAAHRQDAARHDGPPPAAQRRRPPAVPQRDARTALPPHLVQHLERDDLELEQLKEAGFLATDELKLIRAARKQQS